MAPAKYSPEHVHLVSSGYIDCLTATELAALQTFKELVANDAYLVDFEKTEIHIPGEGDDTLFLRFLRARDFDVKKAFSMFSASIEWRRENDVAALRHMTEDEVLGVSADDFSRCYQMRYVRENTSTTFALDTAYWLCLYRFQVSRFRQSRKTYKLRRIGSNQHESLA